MKESHGGRYEINIQIRILGPESIAHKFAERLEVLDNAELYAVVSRSTDKAESFGGKYHIKK